MVLRGRPTGAGTVQDLLEIERTSLGVVQKGRPPSDRHREKRITSRRPHKSSGPEGRTSTQTQLQVLTEERAEMRPRRGSEKHHLPECQRKRTASTRMGGFVERNEAFVQGGGAGGTSGAGKERKSYKKNSPQKKEGTPEGQVRLVGKSKPKVKATTLGGLENHYKRKAH